MRPLPSPAARRTLAAYRRLPLGTRAHVALRWRTCPFERVAAEVPSGWILDIGCGHGAFTRHLALTDPARTVRGVDVDARKIDAARRAGGSLGGRVAFDAVPPGWVPDDEPRWDGIVITDVLYLLGRDEALGLLRAAAAALTPGGRIVVKEIATTPRWKYRLATGQELAATRVARITEGDHVDFVRPDDLAATLRDAGLEVRTTRIDRGYPHPHLLIVGTRTDGERPAGRPGDQPDAAYFATMERHAGDHWWYRARREILTDLLAGRVPAGGTALDIGCGTGEVLDLLAAAGARTVAGTDLSDDALAAARTRVGSGTVLASLAEQLPFADACADVLTSLEVVEHLDDDRLALREYARVVRPGGTLVLTVPAYQGLWSDHDERAGHRRRYRRGEIVDVVAAAGFRIDRASYYFSYLVPPAWLTRRTPLGRLLGDTDDESSANPVLATVFGTLARLERRVLRRPSARLPFGLSILVVATRTDS